MKKENIYKSTNEKEGAFFIASVQSTLLPISKVDIKRLAGALYLSLPLFARLFLL